jgi:hypothetical protein
METIKNGLFEFGSVLIDICYKNESYENRTKYKKFKIELIQKEYSSRLGCYNMKSKTIQLSGLGAYCRRDVIITFIHELSHHIEFIKSGTTGHQKTFYDIHTNLLKVAINLDALNIKYITENKSSNAGNKNKLGKMMVGYIASGDKKLSDYMDTKFLDALPIIIENHKTIKVKSLPEDKDILKGQQYKWNINELVWEKLTKNVEEYNDEINFLSKNGFHNIKIDKKAYFAKYIKICVTGDTYTNKEILSSFGYKYRDGSWLKYVSISYVNKEVMKLRKIKGIKVKYEF